VRRLLLAILLLSASPALAAESVCSQPSTIFCEDWETTVLPGRWIDGYGGHEANITIVSTGAYTGTKALQVNFPAGVEPGWLGTFLTPTGNQAPSGTPGYDHIYVRLFFKLSANWTCQGSDPGYSCGKILAFYGAQSGINGPYNPWSGTGTAGVIPNGTDFYYAGIATGYQNAARQPMLYEYHPEQIGPYGDNVWGPVPLALDTWMCVESELIVNTVGQHNGEHRLWINDQLSVQRTGMQWRTTTNLQTLMFQLSFSLTPPVTQQYYMDNIVVATQRIGCTMTTPPGTPTGVTVTSLRQWLTKIWSHLLGRA
jgi:hypothetical protein